MKIIETKRAPNPRRVRIYLAEKGLEVDFEEVDLMSGALKRSDFVALNPMGGVPVLVLDDGACISETIAICRYFEALHREPPLFGSGALEQARVEMWQRRIELRLFFHIAQAFRHLHPAMAQLEVPQISAWGDANKPKTLAALKLLDEQLAQHEFIAGDMYSVADITALVAIDFMPMARIERPSGAQTLPHLERWLADVTARPSAAA